MDTRERESLRESLIRETPSWYNPYVHLAIPSLFGLGIIVTAIVLIHGLSAWELLTIPVTYILANALEWHAHRDLLHHRNPLAPALYDRHAPQHHQVYVTEDMAMRDVQEFRLVLIPAYGIMLLFLVNSPLTLLLWWLGLPNIAALFIATSMAYVVGYEWLHLSYHLPENHPVGRMKIIKILRHHHAVHHDPRLMQKWNLNVTVPLWDWVRRTNYKKEA